MANDEGNVEIAVNFNDEIISVHPGITWEGYTTFNTDDWKLIDYGSFAVLLPKFIVKPIPQQAQLWVIVKGKQHA